MDQTGKPGRVSDALAGEACASYIIICVLTTTASGIAAPQSKCLLFFDQPLVAFVLHCWVTFYYIFLCFRIGYLLAVAYAYSVTLTPDHCYADMTVVLHHTTTVLCQPWLNFGYTAHGLLKWFSFDERMWKIIMT